MGVDVLKDQQEEAEIESPLEIICNVMTVLREALTFLMFCKDLHNIECNQQDIEHQMCHVVDCVCRK